MQGMVSGLSMNDLRRSTLLIFLAERHQEVFAVEALLGLMRQIETDRVLIQWCIKLLAPDIRM